MTNPPALSEAPATLLVGGAGSGKTYSIPTILMDDRIEELFAFGTEPRFLESLQQSMDDRGISRSRLHWTAVYPATVEWSVMENIAVSINSLSYEDLARGKGNLGKREFTQFIEIYRRLSNFPCAHCSKTFGAVDSWGPERALAIDSTTGLARMSLALTIGMKPSPHEGEWGVAMGNLEQLFVKLTSALRCFLIMTAHVERERDEITQSSQIVAQTLGRKLTPKIIPLFSEVIHAHRLGNRYLWSNVTPNFDLKRRALPLRDDLEPSFGPIVEAYWQRNRSTEEAA